MAPLTPRRAAILLMGGAMLLLLVSFFCVEPLIKVATQTPQQRRFAAIKPGWSLVIQQRSLEVLTCTWFFMLGASLGSFIHCLEYRWPRGISVVARGSACPGCGKAIRLWHNVPVFGWLWLRGRCARCGWQIPARYALTELALGSAFVLLLGMELIGAGLNLPMPYGSEHIGVTENIWDPNWRLIGIFAFHATLITLLLTISLFSWDRFGLHPLLLVMALAIGVICPLVWPLLQIVKWDDLASPLAESRLQVAVGQLAGALAGLVLGNCLVRRTPGNIRAGDVAATLLGMLLVGLYLGWQAALAIAALLVVLRAVLSLTAARAWPVVASIAVATLIHLLAWRWLSQSPLYPALHDRILATLAVVVAVPVTAVLVDSIEHGGDAGPTIIDAPAFPETVPLPSAAPEPAEPVT